MPGVAPRCFRSRARSVTAPATVRQDEMAECIPDGQAKHCSRPYSGLVRGQEPHIQNIGDGDADRPPNLRGPAEASPQTNRLSAPAAPGSSRARAGDNRPSGWRQVWRPEQSRHLYPPSRPAVGRSFRVSWSAGRGHRNRRYAALPCARSNRVCGNATQTGRTAHASHIVTRPAALPVDLSRQQSSGFPNRHFQPIRQARAVSLLSGGLDGRVSCSWFLVETACHRSSIGRAVVL